MSNDKQRVGDFKSVKDRLAEIAEAVADESLSLDDALDLYEEAVALGLKASDLLEVGIETHDDEPLANGGSDTVRDEIEPAANGTASAERA